MRYTCLVCNTTWSSPQDRAYGYCGLCNAFTAEPDSTQWVIYAHPNDHPSSFAVRPWYLYAGMSEPVPGGLTTHPTLEQARGAVPAGLYLMPSDSRDDPTIVEVWI